MDSTDDGKDRAGKDQLFTHFPLPFDGL